MATSPSDDALETALDRLIDLGVVEQRDGGLVLTSAFESTRAIYRDTYADADDDTFREAVAETFDADRETVAERIDAGDLSRADLIAYLSLRSFLDDPDEERLVVMATLVTELSPGSPVPAAVEELDDDSWETFLDANPDAVVTVWRHDCVPCEALKDDLDDVLATVPDGVAVAGVDGESVPAFRETFDVSSAPAVCCFRDGDLKTVITGRREPETYAETFEDWY